MGTEPIIFEISSDEDEDWLSDLLDRVNEASDSFDDVVVVDEKVSCAPAIQKHKFVPSNGMKGSGSDSDDDCLILDGDPDKSITAVDDTGNGTDDLLIVGEKGQLACRDYPHPRHLCAKFPFTTTPHDKHCDLCGQELGEMLLNLSRAWEQADTSTSTSIASKFPSLHGSFTDNVKSAFGKRLVSAGRRFQSMGQYGEGELQRIAKVMIKTGKLLSASPVTVTDEKPKVESRMFKFGELQVELTPQKANIGAAIGFVYGILSWQLSKGIQSIPESSLQYANDNALLLAKSLRGALLALCYSSTILSALSTVGLILLGRQLSSEAKSKE